MAKKVEYRLVDDVDGSDADESVSFGLDGVSYEIDLSADNAAAMRDALAVYVGHATRVGGRKARAASGGGRKAGRGDTAAVREWARAQGLKVNDRGRIPAAILAQYEAEA